MYTVFSTTYEKLEEFYRKYTMVSNLLNVFFGLPRTVWRWGKRLTPIKSLLMIVHATKWVDERRNQLLSKYENIMTNLSADVTL